MRTTHEFWFSRGMRWWWNVKSAIKAQSMGPKIFLNRTSVLKLLQFHSITVLSQLGKSCNTCAELWAAIRLRAAIYLVNHNDQIKETRLLSAQECFLSLSSLVFLNSNSFCLPFRIYWSRIYTFPTRKNISNWQHSFFRELYWFLVWKILSVLFRLSACPNI